MPKKMSPFHNNPLFRRSRAEMMSLMGIQYANTLHLYPEPNWDEVLEAKEELKKTKENAESQ